MRIYFANLFWPTILLNRHSRNILLLCFKDVLGTLRDAEITMTLSSTSRSCRLAGQSSKQVIIQCNTATVMRAQRGTLESGFEGCVTLY